MKIFIYQDGEVRGPFSRFEIFAGLQKGTFANEDTACVEGNDEWKTLQQLLTGTLGVGSKAPAANPPDPVVSPDPELLETPVPPEPTPPDLMPWEGDLPPRPTPISQPRNGQPEPAADRLRDLADTWGMFGLLFFVVAALTLAVGRTKFLHRASIVAIKTNRASPGQKSGPVPSALQSTAPVAPSPNLHGPTGPAVAGKVAAAAPDQASQVQMAWAAGTKDLPAAGPKEATASVPTAPRAGSGGASSPESERRTITKKKLFEIPRFTPRELVDVLTERFTATTVNTAGSVTKEDPNVTIREGSFVLDTGLTWNPQVEVVYSIPLYKNSAVGPRAANVMMWAGHPGAMAPPKEEMVDGKLVRARSTQYNLMAYYARELGYTTFSMNCVTRTWNDPEETYFLGGPKWVDLVFKAQDEITRMFKLPPRKLIMTGVSIGASCVERIAAARPDKVAAITLLDAPEITLPKQASDTLWYMQISRGDSMQAQYETLYNTLLNQNGKVLFDIFPPDYGARGRRANMYHTESALVTEATRSFLDGVASRRDAVGNLDPTTWPFVRDQDHPYVILSRNSPSLDHIAPAKREFLPSERMVHCLQSLPIPIHALMLPQASGSSVRCFVGLPPLGRPRGVLVYAPEASYRGITDMFNDVYFLTEKGYLVLCPYTMQPGNRTLSATLKFVQGTPLLKELPIVLVGVGENATQLWQDVSRSNLDPSAMVLLKFKPGNLLDESKSTLETHPIRFPVLFVEDEAELLKVSTTAEAKENLAEAHQIDDYVAKCRERHQISRVILIPDVGSSEELNAQKTVQAVNNAFADLVEGHRGTILK